MFDLKLIRETPEFFDSGWVLRGLELQSAKIIAMDEKHRAILVKLQELQSKRNDVSKEIGIIKSKGGDASDIMKEVAGYKEKISAFEEDEKNAAAELNDYLSSLPNIPDDIVPKGKDESDNKEIRKHGDAKLLNNAKEHFDIGVDLGGMDFETAAKLSGARFVLLKGGVARLERALAQFMLDTHTQEHGYTEVSAPLLVRAPALYGTGQLPKFEEDMFKTNTGHYLISTSEIPLTNIVADSILDAHELPLRMTALTPCFRSEAGSAGKDTRGMIRQHQFYKVEMVSIVEPDKSQEEHERMTNCAEVILQKLGLSYRTVVLCSGDLGFSARRTYDIEVWLPGQNAYREISSCSNCGDFQARRMKARYKKTGEKKTQYIHTLNGSGVATGRCLIAILENYQQMDGSVIIPEVLHKYMGGVTKLEAVK